MSKPSKPGELRDVTVNAISLVSKAANGQRFKIFKSAEPEEHKEAPAPEVVNKDERGLFSILKEFFTGEKGDKIEKGAVADIVNAQDKGQRLARAMDALFEVLGLNRWGEPSEKTEVNPAQIRAAIEDFKVVAEGILLDKDEDIKKTVTELEKSGRKISGTRLTKLKSIKAILDEVLSGLEENDNTSQGEEELTKEEIQKAVDEVLKPDGIIEKAIQKALVPVYERLEKVEKARGVSNRVQEESTVEKDSDDFWGGVF